METDQRLPSGQWNGFYLENYQPRRGWMQLYLTFADGKIKGEGTDYVGPWTATGSYDLNSGLCTWVKQYVGKHQVAYSGKVGEQGIIGQWEINYVNLTGQFHIWPIRMTHLNELYLTDDLTEPTPSIQLGTVPVEELTKEMASFT